MRRTYPSTFWKYTTHLLRCCAQINPQRIKDTPAVNLCSRLVSVSSISKGLRKGFTVYAASENSQRIGTNKDIRVQLLNRLFRKALETGKRLTESFFKTVG